MPMPIPAMMLRKIAVPAERFSLTIIFPDMIVHSAKTEPTLKSIPPRRMTKVIPSAITVLMLICVKMFEIFVIDPNLGATNAKMTHKTKSTAPMPPSCSMMYVIFADVLLFFIG